MKRGKGREEEKRRVGRTEQEVRKVVAGIKEGEAGGNDSIIPRKLD